MNTRVTSTLIVLMILLSACAQAGSPPPLADGQIIQMQVGSTWYGITQALSGATGTRLLEKSNQVVAVWNAGEAWCVAFLNGDSAHPVREFIKNSSGKSMVMNAKTISEFTTWMEEQGWKVITPAAVPSKLQMFLTIPKAVFQSLANSLTTFVIIPAGVTTITEEFLKKYTGSDGKYY